jgi:hypothetical protein
MAAADIVTGIVTGGVNNAVTVSEQANAYATDLITQGIVSTISNTGGVSPATGGFAVNQSGTPAMTVDVTAGIAYVTGTPSGQASQSLRAKMSANYTAYAISANSSGSTKYDWIYLKLDPTKAAAPAAASTDVINLYTSRSTSNSSDNGTPPTYGLLLAVVTVANAASSIVNANIADKRVNITTTAPGLVTNTALAGSIAPSKISNPYIFRVRLSGNQTGIADSTSTVVVWNTKDSDPNTNFNTSTGKYTIPVTGYYQINCNIRVSGTGLSDTAINIYKGLTVINKAFNPNASENNQISFVYYFTAGDVLSTEIYANITSGTASVIADSSSFSGFLIAV